MRHPNLPPTGSEGLEAKHFASSFELKELASMFRETAADEETVLGVIEDALLQPIPALEDKEAMEEYNARMEMLRQMAREHLSRSELLKELWQRIEDRSGHSPSG